MSDASLDDIATPRSTGEIISDAVYGLRRSFAVIFTLAVPFCAIDLFLREAGGSFLLQVTAKIDPLHADLSALDGTLPAVAAGIGFLLASFFTQSLLNGAVLAVGDDLCWRRPVSVKAALARLAERGAPLILTSMLFLLVITVASTVVMAVPMGLSFAIAVAADFIPLIVIGTVVAILLMLAAVIVLTLRWSLYAPAVVVEDRSMFAALSRSSALTAARGLPFFETPKFRLSVLLLVGLALSGVLQSLFFAPRLVLAAVTGWSFANGAMPGLAQMPIWFMVPFGLLEIVTNAAVIPFSGLLLSFFAFDLRVRYEGVAAEPGSPTP
jgi:hypothetical protein